MDKIRIALIGFGGIARVHNKVYAQLIREGYPIELVAVCEKTLERIKHSLDFNLGVDNTSLPEGIHLYTDVDEMIRQENFDVADICLPTFLHKEMSIKLLGAGKHVLCEKPMALTSDDCDEMVGAAKRSGKRFMIGQCVRFDPAYVFLRDAIADLRFGALCNVYLDRHTQFPTWGADDVFKNIAKSGGCMLDTHIHDIDVSRFLLEDRVPDAVSSVSFDCTPAYQGVTSTLFYGDATVIANGSWDSARSTAFEAGYRARFENAGVVYDGKELWVVPNGGERYRVPLSGEDFMVEELRYFVNLVLDDRIVNQQHSPESAAESVRLVERLRQSAAANGEKLLLS